MGFSHYWKLMDANSFEKLDGIILIDWNNFCMSLAGFVEEGCHISGVITNLAEICSAIVKSGLKIIVVADGKSDAARCVIKLSRQIQMKSEDYFDNFLNSTNSYFVYEAAFEISKVIFKNCPQDRYTFLRANGEADPELRRIAREIIISNRNVYIFSGDASLIVGAADTKETSRLLKMVDVKSLCCSSTGVGLIGCTLSVKSFLGRLNDMCNMAYSLSNSPNIGPRDIPILAALLDDERRTQKNPQTILKFIANFFWCYDNPYRNGDFKTMLLVCAGICIKAAKRVGLFFIDGTYDLNPHLFFTGLVKDCLIAGRLLFSSHGQVSYNQRIKICGKFLRKKCNNRNCSDGRHITRNQIDNDTNIELCVPVIPCVAICGQCYECLYGGCEYKAFCHRSHDMTRRGQYINTKILKVLRRTNTESFTKVCRELIDNIGQTPDDERIFINELLRRFRFVSDEGVADNNYIFKVNYVDDNIGGSVKRLSPLSSLYYQLNQINDLPSENYVTIPFDHIECDDSDSFNTWYTQSFKEQNLSLISSETKVEDNGNNDYLEIFTEFVAIEDQNQNHYTASELFHIIDSGRELPLNGILLPTKNTTSSNSNDNTSTTLPPPPPPTTTNSYGLKWFEVGHKEINPMETCHPHQCYQSYNISVLSNLRLRAELFDSLLTPENSTSLTTSSCLSPDLLKRLFGFHIDHYYDHIARKVISLWKELTNYHTAITSPSSVLVMLSTVYSFYTMAFPVPIVKEDNNILSTSITPATTTTTTSINCMDLFGVSFHKLLPWVIEACLLSPLFSIAATSTTTTTTSATSNNKKKIFLMNMTTSTALNANISSIIEQIGISSNKRHYTLVNWMDEITYNVFELTGGKNWDSLSWFDLLGISTVLLLLHSHRHHQQEQPVHIYDIPELTAILQLNEDFDIDRLVYTIDAIIKWLNTSLVTR